MQNLYRLFLGIAAAAAIVLIVMLVMGYGAQTGPLAVALFVALAIGIRGTRFSGLSFTAWILSAVAASMYYPQYFRTVGDFKLTLLIVPLMQIIMFGMGTQMSLADFVGVAKMPRGVIVGMLCQFTIMPLVGFSLAKIFGFPPEIGAGLVLIGSVPCGLASNVMNYIAGNNLALAVSLTAFATIAAPIMTPFLMKMLAGTMVDIVFINMMLDIIYMVIIPIGAGLMFNHYSHNRLKWADTWKHLALVAVCIAIWLGIPATGVTAENWLKVANLFKWLAVTFVSIGFIGYLIYVLAKGNTKFLDRTMPLLSMAGIAYIITIITASGRDNLLVIGPLLVVAAILHNSLGYTFGYLGSRLLGMGKRDSRTIAIEVGLQNGGLASGLALQMGKVATMGLAPAVFGPWMNISGSALANYFGTHPVKESKPVVETEPA